MAESNGSPKKRKVDEDGTEKILSTIKFDTILRIDTEKKNAFLAGSGEQGDAVIALEKQPFSKETAADILEGDISNELIFKNDVYHTFKLFPKSNLNFIKATLTYPATQKHILKYSDQKRYVIEETSKLYNDVTLPFILQEQMNIEWVFNILSKKTESERIVYEDPDPNVGFILLPDMKWSGLQLEDMYCVALVHARGIKSIRDLDDKHLPLLKNIKIKGSEAIQKKYGLESNQLRIYFHYQPSYYHLHIHFNNISYEAPGSNVATAYLLSDVINNIELMSDYYKKATLSFVLKEQHKLLEKFKSHSEEIAIE
ncbi:DgyrCDS1329 [Dimorphilus gyrociliatus]|uniref:m7GpppX diphosphatase n=1 Tax=Dimorphilus gyrociliatus TaxID=2664684 RepID=A0A7I8V6X9_9ANNE|nr:DgyrCDS1329 [Dimorphilus gyrociliatus]